MVLYSRWGCEVNYASCLPVMQQFEYVSPGVADGTGVLQYQVKVLKSHVPHWGRGVWEVLRAHEEGRVVEVCLCAHDALGPRRLQAAVHVRQILDVAVSEDGHANCTPARQQTITIKYTHTACLHANNHGLRTKKTIVIKCTYIALMNVKIQLQ